MLFVELETPAVLIEVKTVERNIQRFQAHCNQHQIHFRPHIKTHKLPAFAQLQMDAGAVGINCQKLGEAEVMAEHGLQDILITYNILGQQKLQRLLALSHVITNLAVTADSQHTIQGLAETFHHAPTPLRVLVECDTGAHRCGAASPEEAVNLACLIDAQKGLSFGGLMTYPPKKNLSTLEAYMVKAKQLLAKASLPCMCITSGGTPDMWEVAPASSITEYRAGTYIYNDRSLVEYGTCTWADCALKVLATVVSAPSPGRAVIDAGSKTLSSDLLGLTGHGHVLERPDIRIVGLSEEHGVLEYPQTAPALEVGEVLQVIPNHACVVSNLTDTVTLVRDGHVLREERVLARGRVR